MISIIICTYDRHEILKKSVLRLVDLIAPFPLEVIIVNNGSEDLAFIDRLEPSIITLPEENIGLSHARNRGAKEASNEWLFYLDDDALLKEGSLEAIFHTIQNYNFQLFTGIWTAWYKDKPPKWIPFDTGNYLVKGKLSTREIGEDTVSGGVMIIKKSILQEVGGFPTNLGMRGNSVAYGEESYVEQKVKELGYRVGINPNIEIEHLVGKHKYTLSWHLKAAKAKGKAHTIINGKKNAASQFLQCIGNSIISLSKGGVKLLIKRDYYIQNLFLDTIGHWYYFLGVKEGNKVVNSSSR